MICLNLYSSSMFCLILHTPALCFMFYLDLCAQALCSVSLCVTELFILSHYKYTSPSSGPPSEPYILSGSVYTSSTLCPAMCTRTLRCVWLRVHELYVVSRSVYTSSEFCLALCTLALLTEYDFISGSFTSPPVGADALTLPVSQCAVLNERLLHCMKFTTWHLTSWF